MVVKKLFWEGLRNSDWDSLGYICGQVRRESLGRFRDMGSKGSRKGSSEILRCNLY